MEFAELTAKALVMAHLRKYGPVGVVSLVGTNGSKYGVQHCELLIDSEQVLLRCDGPMIAEDMYYFEACDVLYKTTGCVIYVPPYLGCEGKPINVFSYNNPAYIAKRLGLL